MKKLLYAFLAVLLIAGAAYAVSIPQTEDAENGPFVWYVPVYNSNASTLAAGDVVVWEIDESTGDNDNWVEDTTTADTPLVAGVIWPSSIAVGASGTMAVHGVVECTVDASGVGAMGTLCTSTTAGSGGACAAGANYHPYAIATETIGISGTGKCMVIVQ